MVRAGLVAALFAAVAGVQAQKVDADKVATVEPGKFIIEFEDNANRDELYKAIEGVAVKKLELNYKHFKGVSIQYKDADDAEAAKAKLAELPSVKNVFRSHRRSIPKHEVHWSGEGTNVAGASGTAKRQNTGATTFSPHLMTQVDKLREKGVLGTGIKVAVIDTGVDYKHPALGGCFGPGCLVQFGYDLVGDAFNGSNTPVPGPDVMDCNGHGSHVSGIIAAQATNLNPFDFTGAAPGVILGHYRVFGCDGDTPDDILIDAYNRAYEAGADLITASIGGPMGWSEDPWAVVVSRIVADGVPCTVSAGNDGDQGLFYASTAANGNRVAAIASVDNILAPVLYTNGTYTIDGATNTSFGFTPGSPQAWAGVTLPLWSVGFDTTDPANACNPGLPADTPDLTNYIVLIRRGTCFYTEKAANAVAKGARYIIYYNNAAGTVVVNLSEVPAIKAVAMVTAEQGAEWVNMLKAGKKLVVAMADPLTAPRFLVAAPNTKSGGFMSTYTSWGPTYEAELKPQFGAPGGLILSTYPRAKGTYAVLSGTSMACPLSAAIWAMIIEARRSRQKPVDPQTIENLLASTANPNLFHDGTNAYPFLAPTAQQGAGMIQAYDAAYATSYLSVSSLAFNDTDHFVPVRNFSITNDGSTSVIYQLSHVGAATGYTFADDSTIYPDAFPNELNTNFASIKIEPASVTIPAGQRRIISVTAAAPAGLDAKRLPVYGGFIAINGSDSTSLSLPYVGVAGSLRSVQVLGESDAHISNSADAANTPVPANTTFMLPAPGQPYTNPIPEVNLEMAFGTALMRFDVVPVQLCTANTTVTEVLGLKILGSLPGSPLEYEPRGESFRRWDGKLADGSYAPAGTYKIAVRALRVYGDRTKASDYDVAFTQSFKIRYPGGAKRRAVKKAL